MLAELELATADSDLVPALSFAFPGFDFNLAQVEDKHWRDTAR